MSEHVYFTAKATSYIRNVERDADHFAVHYERAPVKKGDSTSYGLVFPILIVTGYLDAAESIAQKVAGILNKHWDDETEQSDA